MPIYRLTKDLIFPPVHHATQEGLLAVGGDLRPERLLLAYRTGIFPWYSEGDPILWWSPDPRLVLYPGKIEISRSLKRTIRKNVYHITLDKDFHQVILSCANVRKERGEGTWITQEMVGAYDRLHQLGHAHSVEAWYQGNLVGGLYGISLGRSFFGESMFSTRRDASKVALVYLTQFLIAHAFDMIDCQLPNDHLVRLGACEISRQTYITQLKQSLLKPSLIGSWKEQIQTFEPKGSE